MGKKLTISIDYDHDAENPCENDGCWKLYSFNSRHVNFKHPNEFFTNGKPKSLGLRRKLEVGTAFLLSYFEHGTSIWMLKNSRKDSFGGDWQWDGVDFAGVLVFEEPASNMGAKTYEDRAKDAKAFLEEYNNWVNGHCYFFSIRDENGKVIGSCGGFIGEEHMFEEIQQYTKGFSPEDIEVEGDAAWLAEHNDVIAEPEKVLVT